MLYYDRTDISQGIDLAKSNNSNECMICIIGFLILDSNFEIMYAICIIHNISKSEAINLLKKKFLENCGYI